jgi:hypothetical protein
MIDPTKLSAAELTAACSLTFRLKTKADYRFRLEQYGVKVKSSASLSELQTIARIEQKRIQEYMLTLEVETLCIPLSALTPEISAKLFAYIEDYNDNSPSWGPDARKLIRETVLLSLGVVWFKNVPASVALQIQQFIPTAKYTPAQNFT